MKLAKEYGIDGFAIYQYYSCGNKLLEIPLELIRDDSTLDLPFYLYWANESWRKTWFGQDNKIVGNRNTEQSWIGEHNSIIVCSILRIAVISRLTENLFMLFIMRGIFPIRIDSFHYGMNGLVKPDCLEFIS